MEDIRRYEMDSLDLEIMNSIKQYPSLFRDRNSVLEHMYCVNGNGYQWVDGRLKCWETKERRRKKFDPGLEYFEKDTKRLLEADGEGLKYRQESYSRQYVTRLKDAAEERFTKKHAYHLALTRSYRHSRQHGVPHVVYPLCEYAKICNIPDDVKPEWLEGAYEVIAPIIFEDLSKYTLPENSRLPADHANNLEWCEKILADLAVRFPSGKPSSIAMWKERSGKMISEVLKALRAPLPNG